MTPMPGMARWMAGPLRLYVSSEQACKGLQELLEADPGNANKLRSYAVAVFLLANLQRECEAAEQLGGADDFDVDGTLKDAAVIQARGSALRAALPQAFLQNVDKYQLHDCAATQENVADGCSDQSSEEGSPEAEQRRRQLAVGLLCWVQAGMTSASE
eukprot:TRINITY_DN33472_c0_g1_i1.p2 TRINITY_DN33472_c0_g1~~TRINITY_DN33472_c0_g1_i1.p2  ORF type:complete len:158 (+),score=32.95 TRINITY_DN33472_c0_g1_i1:546-1019(+)